MNKKTPNDAERELIKRMKNLLLNGARMLDETCPKCGTPLFYMKDIGLKYCPKCNVYVATPAELENAKIDQTKLKIIDFDSYWSSERNEEKKVKEDSLNLEQQEKRLEKKDAMPIIRNDLAISSKVTDFIDELICAIIEKIILRVERDFEKISVEELLKILNDIIRIRQMLKTSH